MAHNLYNEGDRTAFAYNEQRGNPWHMLGVGFDGDQTLEVMLQTVGADRDVERMPLYAMTPEGFVEVPEHWATVRQANDAFTQNVLGVVGNRFEIVQDAVVAEIAMEIVGLSGSDAAIDTMGLLGNTERFFTYIRFPELVIDPLGIADTIERGLVATHAHDGTAAITIGTSTVRVVCANTLAMAMGSLGQAIRVKHTASAEDRVRTAAAAMGYAAAVEEQVIAKAEAMLGVPAGPALDAVFRSVWPLDDDMSDRKRTNVQTARSQVRNLLDAPTNDVGRNGWAVYNAAVEYLDWKAPMRGRKDAYARAERTVTSTQVTDAKVQVAEAVLALA